MWAAAQCCSDDAAELLAPVCDSWAALPDETEEEYSSSPRNNLASHEIRFAFQEKLPEPAILYFIERTDSSDLRWPITFMLHGIDHPAVVEFLARELAASDESFLHLLTTIESTWSWRQERTGRAMSDASRHRLHEMWANRSNEKRLRELALRLWCSTTSKEDIPVLQTVSTGDDIETQALYQRLKRGDHEATSSLIEKLRQDTIGYWWRAGRHIWSDELTTILDAALHRRGEQMGRTWSPTSNYSLDEVLSECLMELPTRTAEELLVKHWCHLRYSSYYVQVALYTATPRLTKIAAKAIFQCTYPESVFKRLVLHFGLMIKGRRGITRMEQLEALLPYFEYLSDDDFRMLWDVCNRNGWFVFRRHHLDPHVRSDYTDDTRAMASLDDMFRRGQPFFLNPWIEKFFEAGASVDHVMEVVQNWLIHQTDIRALVMAADIVANYGRRCHGSILCSHNIEANDKAQSIIANASFALKRRSLN